ALLREVPIFGDLSRRELGSVAAVLHRRSVAAGEVVVREGEAGVGMYVILQGQVRIVQRADDGASQVLATLGPGDFFGEQALLDESPRTATAVASSPCDVVGLFRPDLLDLIEGAPRLGLKIVLRLSQMMSARLRYTNRLLREARTSLRHLQLERQQQEGAPRQGAGSSGTSAAPLSA
ncbi:MAG: cyclic nucleotide-binding domain-containing protein, partial [Candidatus Latescibacterota bacterium]